MSGKIKRAQQGRNPGHAMPFGYTKGDESGQWVVLESEAVVVRRIFREYIGGRGIHTIAAGLNAEGVKPRRAAFWRGETIIKMINNPVYTGLLRYGLSAITTKAQRKQLASWREDTARRATEAAGEMERLRGALAGLAKEVKRLEAADWSLADLEELAARLDAWECLSPDERKQLLRHFVARCVVYRARSGREIGQENENPVEVELELRKVGV